MDPALAPKAGEAVEFKLTLNLPSQLQHDKYILQFCFADKEAKFGQSLVAVIHILNEASSLVE